LFKRVWKILDPESKFIGSGGPIDVPLLPGHLDRLHRGVGEVHVDQTTRPGHTDVRLGRAAPLDRFSANANGGQVTLEALQDHLRQARAGFPVDPNNGRVPPLARFPRDDR
jgi:hypothetical protein